MKYLKSLYRLFIRVIIRLSHLFSLPVPCQGFLIWLGPYSASRLWLERRLESVYRTDRTLISYLIGANPVLIDIGANVGIISLGVWADSKGSGAIAAIEPHPRTFNYLARNVSLNNASIDIFPVCLGATHGTDSVAFSDSSSDECNAVCDTSYYIDQSPDLYQVDSSKTLMYLSPTLDALFPPNCPKYGKTIDLIKVDTEGFEFFVFQGSTRCLQRSKYIYFEYWSKLANKYGYSLSDIISLLSPLGFTFFVPRPSCESSNGFVFEPLEHSFSSAHGIYILAVNTRLAQAPLPSIPH